MFKNKIFLLGFVLVLLSQVSVGQNNTNSPYIRVLDMARSVIQIQVNKGHGWRCFRFAIQNWNQCCKSASYSAVDSMTFMFDVGVSALVSRFSETEEKTNKLNANLEYITMQFPLWKKVGFSAEVWS